MKCIVCGKNLTGHKRKYCCPRCAQIGFISGLAKPKDNTEAQVKDLYEYFKVAFNVSKDRFSSLTSWKARVFIKACYKLGYSASSIARGLGKNHADIIYHYNKASDKEASIAKEFLSDIKNFKYEEPVEPEKPERKIYPEGFHY